MRNSSLVPKLGKDAAALPMNGIGYCFPANPLLAVVDSGCAEPTLTVFAYPDTFADDESGRRALLIVFAHEIIGYMPGIMCSPTGERGHHDLVGQQEVTEPLELQQWMWNLGQHRSEKTNRFNTNARCR